MPSSPPDETKQQSGVEIGDVSGGIHEATIAGRDVNRVRVRQVIRNVFGAGRQPAAAQRHRQAMLQRVRRFWIEGVLEKSLHGLAMVEVGLAERPEAVDNPLNMIVTANSQNTARPLPPDSDIGQIFEALGRSLLILGQAGSGKTTLLLQLARQSLIQAEQGPAQPLPVIFNLSSWPGPATLLADWLVEELKVKYQLSPKIGTVWLENRELLLLLDGLDEVNPERREACVTALNRFSQQYGLKNLVVCSRQADYQQLQTRLTLEGAVLLKPLTRQQVAAYVQQAGPTLNGVRQLLAEDQTMQELVRSPLMLSIVTLAYRDQVLAELRSPDSLAQRRNHLFETYIERMFRRLVRTRQEDYPQAEIIAGLRWLAQRMLAHNQSIFLLEQLQPSWLDSPAQRWSYAFGSRLLAGLLLGLGSGFFLWTMAGVTADQMAGLLVRLVIGLLVGVLGGGLVGLLAGFRLDRSARRDAEVRPAASSGCQRLLNGAAVGLATGTAIGLCAWLGEGLRLTLQGSASGLNPWVTGLIFGLLRGGVLGLVFGGLFGFKAAGQEARADIQPVEALHWSWPAFLRGGLAGLLGLGLLLGLAAGLMIGLAGLVMGLLNYGAAALGPALAVSLRYGLLVGGLVWLLVGPLAGLIWGMLAGLRGLQVETRVRPNQGIRDSARNALLTGLLFWLVGGLIFGLLLGLPTAYADWSVSNRLGQAVWLGLLTGLTGGVSSGLGLGLVGGLWYGGLAVIQHASQRIILTLTGQTPWRYTRFLDYAAEHILLYKVGGGYIFIHRLLLEYLASDDNNRI